MAYYPHIAESAEYPVLIRVWARDSNAANVVLTYKCSGLYRGSNADHTGCATTSRKRIHQATAATLKYMYHKTEMGPSHVLR